MKNIAVQALSTESNLNSDKTNNKIETSLVTDEIECIEHHETTTSLSVINKRLLLMDRKQEKMEKNKPVIFFIFYLTNEKAL